MSAPETVLLPGHRPGAPRPPAPTPAVHAAAPSRASRFLLVAIGLGAAVRAAPLLRTDFPLNDGGLFHAMIEDLLASGYRLPAFSSYNGLGMPFAYSPFGFYLAAALSDVTGMSTSDTLRVLPFLGATLVIMAFVALARRLGLGGSALVAATLAFALVPRSFVWLVMGGGLTRSFGVLFALLALWQVHRLYAERRWSALPPAAVFAALTVLSHIGTAPWLAVSIGLFFLAFGRHRQGLLASAVLPLAVVALTAPWWVAVVWTHGWEPFIAARATGDTLFTDYGTKWRVINSITHLGIWDTGESFFPVVGTLAVLGGVVAAGSGHPLLPVWWLATLLIDARQGITFATVPQAMMAGLAIQSAILPTLRRLAGQGGAVRRRLPEMVLGLCLVGATVGAVVRDPEYAGETRSLLALNADERAAMRWIARHTPEGGTFLVMTAVPWQVDRYSEWFPILAARRSVATVQGYEWLPTGAFAEQQDLFRAVQHCADVACAEERLARDRASFDYVLLPRSSLFHCCDRMERSLREDPRFTPVYDGPGGLLFARQGRGPVPGLHHPRIPPERTPDSEAGAGRQS